MAEKLSACPQGDVYWGCLGNPVGSVTQGLFPTGPKYSIAQSVLAVVGTFLITWVRTLYMGT